MISRADTGRVYRRISTVIIGNTNVGKSSLECPAPGKQGNSNRYSGYNWIQSKRLLISGEFLRIIDTAGLRETSDFVEKIGVEKTRETIIRPVLVVLDAVRGLDDEDRHFGIDQGKESVDPDQ